VVITGVEVSTVRWPHIRTDELSLGAEAQLCHEHDVLAHCLAGRQTRLQQCRGSLVAASVSATRLGNTARIAPDSMKIRFVQLSSDTATALVSSIPIHNTDELQKRFVATWAGFQQSVVESNITFS